MLLNEIELIGDISNGSQTFKLLWEDWKSCVKVARPYHIGKVDQFYVFEIDTRGGIHSGATSGLETMVGAFDPTTKLPVAFIELRRFEGSSQKHNIFEELVVAADKKYRGLNLVTKMYALLIKEENFMIVSDAYHSYGGRHVWEQLAKIPGIGIYGYNTDTNKVFQIDMDDWFNEDVYNTGLDDEIEDLQRELSQLQFSPNPDQNRVKQIEKELKTLADEKENTVNNVRLFAAKAK